MLRRSDVDKDEMLQVITELFTVVDTTAQDIIYAKQLHWKDFEDAVQYAVALREDVDFFITRNKKDFELNNNNVVTPEEFLVMKTE